MTDAKTIDVSPDAVAKEASEWRAMSDDPSDIFTGVADMLDALAADRDRIAAENERLRVALKPFAYMGSAFDNSDPKDDSPWAAMTDADRIQIGAKPIGGWWVTVGDFRRAASASGGK